MGFLAGEENHRFFCIEKTVHIESLMSLGCSMLFDTTHGRMPTYPVEPISLQGAITVVAGSKDFKKQENKGGVQFGLVGHIAQIAVVRC